MKREVGSVPPIGGSSIYKNAHTVQHPPPPVPLHSRDRSVQQAGLVTKMRQKVSGCRARRRRRMMKMLQLAAAGAAAMEYERNLLVASSAACAAAIQQLPKERDTRKPRRRLNWDDHARECVEQGTFTRMYRMTFNCSTNRSPSSGPFSSGM